MLEQGDDTASRLPLPQVQPHLEGKEAAKGTLPAGSPIAAGATAGAAAVTAGAPSLRQSAARAQICKWLAGAAGVPLAGAGAVLLGE